MNNKQTNKDKAIRLMQFLSDVNALKTKTILDIQEYQKDPQKVIWFHDIPKSISCSSIFPIDDQSSNTEVWLEVKNKKEPKLDIPKYVSELIDE